MTLTPKEIYVNQKFVTDQTLEAALKEALAGLDVKLVLLRGDKDVLLGDTVRVMSMIKRAGASEIAIAAEAEAVKK